MNKREICDEHPTFAYYSGCRGLEVRFIEYGVTVYMYLIAGQWSSKKSYHKLKIHSGNKYDYIVFRGCRCRLSDFIKI